MNTDFPHLPRDGLLNLDNGQYRVTRRNQKLVESPGNEQRSEREAQPLGPPEIKAPTDPGGGFRRNKQRKPHWRIPGENSKRGHWSADSQEFPSLEAQRTAGNTKGSAGPSTTEVAIRRRSSGIWTGGCGRLKTFGRFREGTVMLGCVQKTIVTPLSALAENFIPQKISRKQSTQQVPTDNELDRSFAKTGSINVETPQDSIESDIATIGTAYPTEIEKPVAMADVAESSGPAVTGAGGPVVAGTRFLAVVDITGASGPKGTEAGGPVMTGT